MTVSRYVALVARGDETAPTPPETSSGALTGPSERAETALVVPSTAGRANPVDVYLASLGSDASRTTAVTALKRVLRAVGKDPSAWRDMPWWTLRPEHGAAIRARLVARFGPSTSRLTLSMLRAVLRKCFVLGLMTGDAFERTTSWGKVRGTSAPVGRMVTRPEIVRLRAACAVGTAFASALDAAILACGFGGGLRREEIARLRACDLSDDGKKLTVHGKGGKVRVQPLPPWAGGAIEAWLAQRARFPFRCEAMFVVIRAGRARDRGLSKWQVWDRLRTLAQRADVRLTPHDMRRTYASELLDEIDLVTVQNLMGHADPRTTSRYDRRPERAKEAAADVLEKLVKPTKLPPAAGPAS